MSILDSDYKVGLNSLRSYAIEKMDEYFHGKQSLSSSDIEIIQSWEDTIFEPISSSATLIDAQEHDSCLNEWKNRRFDIIREIWFSFPNDHQVASDERESFYLTMNKKRISDLIDIYEKNK